MGGGGLAAFAARGLGFSSLAVSVSAGMEGREAADHECSLLNNHPNPQSAAQSAA